MTMAMSYKMNDKKIPKSKRNINLGELVFTKRPERFHLLGIGTCLGIYLYDLKKGNYMISHSVLPKHRAKDRKIAERDLGHFTDVAIKIMIKKMKKLGSRPASIKCKLVGGAKIFNSTFEIGKDNIECAKSILEEENIELVAEAIGGTHSRSITEFKRNGDLELKENGKDYTI